jgi:medium-chain acyl-[acyl-carrier-protein] hydrolase
MWQETFRVRFFDAEPGGQASVPAVCRYLEEAAHSQTESLGLSIRQVREAQRMWVLTRFALRVFALPRMGDEVTVQTWASDRTAGIRAYRDFRMLDRTGKTLAEAASLWLLLDLKTRRPVRLPESVLALRYPERIGARPVEAEALLAPENKSCEDRFRVRWSDLDENGHANNLRYIEWIVGTVPDTLRAGHCLAALDLQFVNEVLLGETVQSVSEELPGRSFRHSLSAQDGRVLAIAKTDWAQVYSVSSSSNSSSNNPAASA